MKKVGVKDVEGNEICMAKHHEPLKKEFWENYNHVKTSWLLGSDMAIMIVRKKSDKMGA